jgi:hypothetical protein
LPAPGRGAAVALGHERELRGATHEGRARRPDRVRRRFASDLHRAAAGGPQDCRVANEACDCRAEHDGPCGRLRQQPSRCDRDAAPEPLGVLVAGDDRHPRVHGDVHGHRAERRAGGGLGNRVTQLERRAHRPADVVLTGDREAESRDDPVAGGGREAAAEALDDLRRATADELGELVQVLRIDRGGGYVGFDEAQRDRRHAAALGRRGDPRWRCDRRVLGLRLGRVLGRRARRSRNQVRGQE